MPCQNAKWFARTFDILNHFGKTVSPGLLCAFRFRKYFYDFNAFSLRIFSQFKKLCLNRHYLLVIFLGALASIENAFSFGLSCFHTLGRIMGFHGENKSGFCPAERGVLAARSSHFRTSYIWCCNYTLCANIFRVETERMNQPRHRLAEPRLTPKKNVPCFSDLRATNFF